MNKTAKQIIIYSALCCSVSVYANSAGHYGFGKPIYRGDGDASLEVTTGPGNEVMVEFDLQNRNGNHDKIVFGRNLDSAQNYRLNAEKNKYKVSGEYDVYFKAGDGFVKGAITNKHSAVQYGFQHNGYHNPLYGYHNQQEPKFAAFQCTKDGNNEYTVCKQLKTKKFKEAVRQFESESEQSSDNE